jgi:hypothetical protein
VGDVEFHLFLSMQMLKKELPEGSS